MHSFYFPENNSDFNLSKIPWTSTLPQSSLAKFKWPGGPTSPQVFAIPMPIIRHMMRNPSSPEVYEKMVAACKLLFEMNPLLLVQSMCEYRYLKEEERANKCFMNKLNCMIWLHGDLEINKMPQNGICTNTLLDKTFRCEIEYLFTAFTRLGIRELIFFGKHVIRMVMNRVQVVKPDGRIVMLEDILAALPVVQKFNCTIDKDHRCFNTNSLKKILKLPQMAQMESFELYNLTESFNIEEFYAFAKDRENMAFFLFFENNDIVLSEGYRNRLKLIIERIIECAIPNRIIMYYKMSATHYHHFRTTITADAPFQSDAIPYHSNIGPSYWMNEGTMGWKMQVYR